jgi:hypothetical protein
MIALWRYRRQPETTADSPQMPAGLLRKDQRTARAPCARAADRVDSPQAGAAAAGAVPDCQPAHAAGHRANAQVAA